MVLALGGIGLVVASQGHGDFSIHWLGVGFALIASLMLALRVAAQMWWAATKSPDGEISGVLFLGLVSDWLLGPTALAFAWMSGGFSVTVFIGGLACGVFSQALGNALHGAANVVSATPNINILSLLISPLAASWLWVFGKGGEAHWGCSLREAHASLQRACC